MINRSFTNIRVPGMYNDKKSSTLADDKLRKEWLANKAHKVTKYPGVDIDSKLSLIAEGMDAEANMSKSTNTDSSDIYEKYSCFRTGWDDKPYNW